MLDLCCASCGGIPWVLLAFGCFFSCKAFRVGIIHTFTMFHPTSRIKIYILIIVNCFSYFITVIFVENKIKYGRSIISLA